MDHQPRVTYNDFISGAPKAVAALRALRQAVEETGLDRGLIELIKIRASQINGCAFCIQLHINHARESGVAAEKIDLVKAWREAGVFSEREAVALSWTELLTNMEGMEVSDITYSALLEHFSEREAVSLTIAIGTINQWNRIAVAFRFSPQAPRQRRAETA